MGKANGSLLWIAPGEDRIGDSLRREFESAGFRILEASDAVQALWVARFHRPDLILLNPSLPDASGKSFLKALRSFSRTPVYVMHAANGLKSFHAFSDVYPADGIFTLYGCPACENPSPVKISLLGSRKSLLPSSECEVF